MALPPSPSRLPGSSDVFVLIRMRSLTNKCQTSNVPQKMMLRIKTPLQDRATSPVVPISIPRWAAVSRQCWLTLLKLLELLGQQGWFSMQPFKTIGQLLPCWVGGWAHSRRVDITSGPSCTFPMAMPCIFTRRIPFHSQIISLFSESTYLLFFGSKGQKEKKNSKIVCGKQTHFAKIFLKLLPSKYFQEHPKLNWEKIELPEKQRREFPSPQIHILHGFLVPKYTSFMISINRNQNSLLQLSSSVALLIPMHCVQTPLSSVLLLPTSCFGSPVVSLL